MLQYLNIILDDSAVSFCHYKAEKNRRLISIDTLKAGIRFAMMENLMIQFVYPDSPLPKEYKCVIESIDHFNIKRNGEDADVCVVDDWDFSNANAEVPIVLRTSWRTFIEKKDTLQQIIPQLKKINIVFTDVESFSDAENAYHNELKAICKTLQQCYIQGNTPQVNIISDRISLSSMNNCGAGETNLTLAPNGKFYICPGFYYENEMDSVGDLENGLDIKNEQLYRLDHAPICSHCDAFQCKRCVWLNKKTTLEINTPSHEQCVIAHIERNASRDFLNEILKNGISIPHVGEIKEIDYLDPFEKRNEW